MASLEEEAVIKRGPLKSLNNDISTYVKFVNKTNRTVKMFWYGYDGKLVNYGNIGPRRATYMNTYVTHPWIAKDSVTAFTLLINGETIFFPREHENGVPFEDHNRDQVVVSIPVFKLLQRCAEVVYTHYGQDKIKSSNLPRELKETLTSITEPFFDRSYHYGSNEIFDESDSEEGPDEIEAESDSEGEESTEEEEELQD